VLESSRPRDSQRRRAARRRPPMSSSAPEGWTDGLDSRTGSERRSPNPSSDAIRRRDQHRSGFGADARQNIRDARQPARHEATQIPAWGSHRQSQPRSNRKMALVEGRDSHRDSHKATHRDSHRDNPRDSHSHRDNHRDSHRDSRDSRSVSAQTEGKASQSRSFGPGKAPTQGKTTPRRVRRNMPGLTATASPDQRRQPREKRQRRPASPLVHVIRLLILGVGVGAIAGTILSVWNPAMHPSTASTQPVHSATMASSLGSGQSRSTAATLMAQGKELTGLTPKVAALTQGLSDLVPGVFLVDLDTGDYFTVNGASSFSAASIIKVPILIALLQEVDEGRIHLHDKLTLQQADIGEGSGDMQFSPVGTEFTVLQTITDMIVISDNTATNLIIRRLGGVEQLNQRFRSWGLQQTAIRHLLPDLEGTNTTSPKEMSELMVRLSQGELLSMKSRDRALDIMRRTVTDSLLPSSLREGASISHKTGDIGSLVGDTGIIDMPNGKRYAITAMVKRPHNDARAQELIRQVSASIYDYFDQTAGGRPAAPETVPSANPESASDPASGAEANPAPSE
jgi:beta-lactamase class A